MRTLGLLLLTLAPALAAPGARAEGPELFAAKPYVFREDEKDKRFSNTRLAKALAQVPADPACARVAASYLMALAEAAPFFHKKDERLVLFTGMVAPLENRKFPAGDYLVHLLRRVAIDGKAPEAWLETARQLKSRYKAPIDLARLEYAVDGLQPVDTVELTLGALVGRYQEEVRLAPSLAQASALDRFQDRYIDRDVVWGALVLADIRKDAPPKLKKGESASPPDAEALPSYQATFLVPVASGPDNPFFPVPKREPIRIRARLAPQQYLDVKAAVRTAKYVVHGRLFAFQAGSGKAGSPTFDIELREAILFDDRDWSHYAGFASAQDAAACDACRNDLSPAGLKEFQGVGKQDAFGH